MTPNENRLARKWANLKDTEPALAQLIKAQSQLCFVVNHHVLNHRITWHGHPACLLIINNTGEPDGTIPDPGTTP